MNAYYFCISIHLLSTLLPDSVTAFFGIQFYSKSTVWHSRVCIDVTLILGFATDFLWAWVIIHLVFFLFLFSDRWDVIFLSLSTISWLSSTYVAFCTVGTPSCWEFELLMQTWWHKLNLPFFLFFSNTSTVFQRIIGSHRLQILLFHTPELSQ